VSKYEDIFGNVFKEVDRHGCNYIHVLSDSAQLPLMAARGVNWRQLDNHGHDAIECITRTRGDGGVLAALVFKLTDKEFVEQMKAPVFASLYIDSPPFMKKLVRNKILTLIPKSSWRDIFVTGLGIYLRLKNLQLDSGMIRWLLECEDDFHPEAPLLRQYAEEAFFDESFDSEYWVDYFKYDKMAISVAEVLFNFIHRNSKEELRIVTFAVDKAKLRYGINLPEEWRKVERKLPAPQQTFLGKLSSWIGLT